MKLRIGSFLDKLALAMRLVVIVLGTKDKTVFNKATGVIERAKQVKDELNR